MRKLTDDECNGLIEFANELFGKKRNCPINYGPCQFADTYPKGCHKCSVFEYSEEFIEK